MGDEVRDQKWGSMIRRLIVKDQNQDVFFSSAGHMTRARYGVRLPPKGHGPTFMNWI